MECEDNSSDENITDNEKENATDKPKKTEKRRYEQKFCNAWLHNINFKNWIQEKREANNRSVPFCKVCKVKLSCSKTALSRHMQGKGHKDAFKMITDLSTSTSRPNIKDLFGPSKSSVAKVEIKLCSFIVENNLPIHLSDDLLALVRSLVPTDKTIQKVTLGKQKATNIIRQVLGFNTLQESIAELKSHKFSLIIDETTDRTQKSQLAILVTYFNPDSFKMDCYLIDMVELDDGKADTIYNAVVKCFEQKGIPMENVIGFCADTCNTMFGAHHSVAQMLVANYPWIIPVKCACHLIHLCASHASLQLPKSLEDLCRNISSYFHSSPLRTKNFQQFQEFFDIEKHQMLKAGQTRWLSMKMCVDRVIEQYEALKLYFTGAAIEDPTHTNDSIVKSLNNKFTLAYLEFMAFNLGRFVSFNTLFQSGIPVLYLLNSELKTLLTSLLSDFMKVSFVRQADPWKIDVHDQNHYVSLNEVYVGPCATDTIHSIEDGLGKNHPDIQLFYRHCRSFQIEAVKQILSRFDDCSKFDFLSFLAPASAHALSPPSLVQVFKQIPGLKDVADLRQTDKEWREHAMSPNLSGEMCCEEYWKAVFNEKNQGQEKVYPNLTKVVSTALSLPFSNAAVERVFSQLKLVKSDHRASLKEESLLALLSTKYSFLKKGKRQAILMEPSSEMLNLHKRMKSNADDEETRKLRVQFLEETTGVKT